MKWREICAGVSPIAAARRIMLRTRKQTRNIGALPIRTDHGYGRLKPVRKAQIAYFFDMRMLGRAFSIAERLTSRAMKTSQPVGVPSGQRGRYSGGYTTC